MLVSVFGFILIVFGLTLTLTIGGGLDSANFVNKVNLKGALCA